MTHIRLRAIPFALLALVVSAALWLLAPVPALADAPGTRGEEPAPSGSAGGAEGWDSMRLPGALAPAQSRAPRQDDDGSPWAERQINVGSWILDAGMGIGGALLATVNYALSAGLRRLAEDAPGVTGCSGSLNILWCTPPDLFLDARHPIGAVVRTVWGTLEPLAISIVGVLFTVRIGRMVAAGPSGLAAEGKSLAVSFAVALLWIKGAAPVLRAIMGGLNELHGLVMTQAARELLSQQLAPNDALNFGLQAATLVMSVALIALVVKALMRTVQLTVLIAIAPLMGALLIDRSTSPRFGQWLGKLLDVLLQQTAWVFFLWFGALFYAQSMPADSSQIEPLVTGRILAAVIFGMAIGGEAILAGIGAPTGGAGGLVGAALTSVTSGRFAAAAARMAWRGAPGPQRPPAARPSAPSERASATADPQQSAAARRAGKRAG